MELRIHWHQTGSEAVAPSASPPSISTAASGDDASPSATATAVASVLERPDVLLEIFSKLSTCDLGRATAVCRSWRDVCRNEHLWRAMWEVCLGWEEGEGHQPWTCSESEAGQFPPHAGLSFDWHPTRLYQGVRFGEDTTMMELMRDAPTRAAVLESARAQCSSFNARQLLERSPLRFNSHAIAASSLPSRSDHH